MQKKITIAYIIDKLNIGGTEKQLLETIQFLNKDKFQPILICLRLSDYFSRLNIPCEKHVLNVQSLLSIHGFLELFRLVSYLRKHKLDIVQTYFFDATVFGVLAAKLAGVKRIISCRRDLGFWYTRTILRVLKCINPLVHRFLVNSHAVKQNTVVYESIPPRKIDVIYNGIDFEPFKRLYDAKAIKRDLEVPNGDQIVGMIANLNRPVKRADIFLRAASEVLEKTKNVSFVIVGDGYLRDDLKKLSQNLKIQEKVYFSGLQENIYPYLSVFDVGVIPSDSEGFSNSILEYMAAGVPVVATDVGGNKEIVVENASGVLASPGDYKCMAEKICDLLKDPEKRLRLARNATRLIRQKFAWNRKMKEIEAYYSNLVRDGGGEA